MYAFSFESLSRAFSNRCVFDENANAKRISVSGRPRRIEMHAFSSENASVRRGFKSMRLDIIMIQPASKLCGALWQRGGKRKESLQLRLSENSL